MERLTPIERAAFVLSEVFDYEYSEIVSILNQSEPSCRQILRKRLRGAFGGVAIRQCRSEASCFARGASLREDIAQIGPQSRFVDITLPLGGDKELSHKTYIALFTRHSPG
jgi:RNA polymerase sigma-70 factor (ECF subfamily)